MENMKENTTWQTVYEQLQNIADAFAEYKWYAWINVEEDRVELKPTWWYELITMSYHDLFSKDSWFLQFLDRQYTDDYHTSRVDHAYDMVEMTAEEKCKYVVENAKLPTKSE